MPASPGRSRDPGLAAGSTVPAIGAVQHGVDQIGPPLDELVAGLPAGSLHFDQGAARVLQIRRGPVAA